MNIVLGVGGGIAAYKSAELARLFIKRGDRVQAVLTRSAQEFITPLTFAALTGRKVITDLFSDSPEGTLSSAVEHIGVAQENDVLVVAPATANILARFAHGIADDFLSTLYLAFTGTVVLAPAMNDKMWSHAATQANLQTLRSRGHIIVEPDEGFLACGTVGPGRLANPETIAAAVSPTGDLTGETILITAGPTQEPLDPVRYLSNRSSGKMGYALAESAVARGAKVILVSGPVSLPRPGHVDLVPVRTAQEMHDAVFSRLEEATIVIKCAAVADFRVANVAANKIKKTAARVSLELDPTPDILAAETENLRTEAKRKLEAKNCDMLVANLVGDGKESGFESDSNEVLLALRSGEMIELPRASKKEIANQIFERILQLRRWTLNRSAVS
jgi:phosphopantothenoylcysteine decarboxylase / phosphopantothenate---cysteine ligase